MAPSRALVALFSPIRIRARGRSSQSSLPYPYRSCHIRFFSHSPSCPSPTSYSPQPSLPHHTTQQARIRHSAPLPPPRHTAQQLRIRHSAPPPPPRQQPGSSRPSRPLATTYSILPLQTRPYSQTRAAAFTHGSDRVFAGPSSNSQVWARGLRSSPRRTLQSGDACRRAYSSAAEQEQEAVKEEDVVVGPEAPDYLDEKERAVFEKLDAELAPSELEVQDISGGCGSMYAIAITSAKFKGLPVIKQHRLVNAVLGEQIKSWHGVQLRTKAP